MLNHKIVVINTTLTQDLLDEGIAREIVSKIKNLRKTSEFDIADRIEVKYSADKEVKDAIYEVGAKEKEVVFINKNTFGSTVIPELLRTFDEEIESVEIIGLCTDICVVSNAMLIKANFPEMDITVDASCCAGVTPDTHNAALTTMKMCQINVIGG